MPSSVHVDANRGWGGGQVQSLGLALALTTRGEETWFLAQRQAELVSRLKSTYLKWEEADLRGLKGITHLGALGRRFNEMKVDIVHVHDAASLAICGLAARAAGQSRVVVTRRTVFPLRWPGVLKYRLCDKVICVSEAVRKKCLEAGLPETQLTVIPDFVDCRHFDPAAVEVKNNNQPVIAMVGRLSKSKGHRVLLRAMSSIVKTEPDVKLVICGTGEEEAALKTEAKMLALDAHIEFTGFVPDVRTVLAQADIIVLPSLSEGLGVAALEAMAMAKPLVVSDAGGLPEAVISGETGLVARAGEAQELVKALITLLRDPEWAKQMGAAGRERALALFDRPRVVDKVIAVYEEVLGKAGG